MNPVPAFRLQSPPVVPTAPQLDTVGLVRRCGGEADLAHMILLEFMRSYGELAGRLDAALDTADARQVEEALHAIAGVAANVGAPWISGEGILLRRRVEREGLGAVTGELAAWRTAWMSLPATAQRAADQLAQDGF
ncbi:MAG: Hpt domain-containing protein [Vicinamibacterales bacterium]